jgi:hypothetical protein
MGYFHKTGSYRLHHSPFVQIIAHSPFFVCPSEKISPQKKRKNKTPPPHTHNEGHPQDELAKFGSNSKKEKYWKKDKGNPKYFQGAARILDN